MIEKYDRIGSTYNNTRKADPTLFDHMYSLMAPKVGERFLDIGCGSGNYTGRFIDRGVNMSGVDPSSTMLDFAKDHYPNGNWTRGSAEEIPYKENTFEGVLATLTLHHWSHLPTAFTEIQRVLKDEGRFVIFTSTKLQMEHYWLNHYFPVMMKDSIKQMPSLQGIMDAANSTHFVLVEKILYNIHDGLEDKFLYVGKTNPSFYLDPDIRRGISSFSDLAYDMEVEKGLNKLKHDIKNGKIDSVIKEHQHQGGDYMFLKFQKRIR